MAIRLPADQGAFLRLRAEGIIRNDQGLSARDRNKRLWAFIVSHEVVNGTSFVVTTDGELYGCFGLIQEIIHLPKNGNSDRLSAYLHQAYGLVEREALAHFIQDSMRHYGVAHASVAELRRFSAYDAKTMTAYVSGYDGTMWKLDGGSPSRVMNGSDGVFFADDDGGLPIDPEVDQHHELLDLLTSLNFSNDGLSGIKPHQQQMALIVWIFMLAFPDLMPTKPLLVVEGTPGAGKSAGIMLIQDALLGAKKPMALQKNREDDFGVQLLRSPIALFDNVDSFIEWVPDAICTYCTSGFWVKRKLYTDNEESIIRPHAFPVVASKNPASFRREDVADRTILIRLERRETFTAFAELEAHIKTNRGRLFGEYLWYVNEIVEELRVSAADAQVAEIARMADFAKFARTVAKVMQWNQTEVDNLLLAMACERDAFINEGDPLVGLMHTWITHRYRPGTGIATNINREVSLQTLFTELETVSQAASIPFYKSTNTLTQKIRSPHVERDFIIENLTRDNTRYFRIRRRKDPQLSVVSGGNGGLNFVNED